MNLHLIRTSICALLGVFTSGLCLRAAGPGLGNLTYTSGENRTRISIVNDSNPSGATGPGDGHGNVAMHDGYLATIYTEDGGGSRAGFAFWNVSNPRSPVRVANHRPSNSKLREPHGFGFTTGFNNRTYFVGQSTDGIQVWDWTDVFAPTLVRDIPLSGANSSDYGGIWWVSVQAPYLYVAGGDRGLFVVNITNPSSPVIVQRDNSFVGLSRTNQVHAVGNLLIAGRVEGGKGIALLDISDPMNPVSLFDTTSNLPTPYSSIFAGGKIYFASKGSNGQSGSPARGLYGYTVNFNSSGQPSGLSLEDFVGSGLGDGGYLSFQDGFVFAGFSDQVAKFDARTSNYTQVFAVATNIPNVPDGGEDIDFDTVLGNIIFAGQDHGNGSGIVVHQTAPDTTGPAVNFVSPRDNDVNRNIRSRIGVTFTDGIDIRSLNTSTFIVRRAGTTTPLPGKYSVSNNHMVNFAPDALLAANTTYEVVVPAGGVRDFAGNATSAQFLSRFSTGPTIGTPLDLCNIGADTAANVGTNVSFTATVCSSGTGGVTYSFNFGDGSPATPFASSNTASHAYAQPGHYNVIVTARDSSSQTDSMSRRQTIIYPVTANAPTRSSTIVHDSTRGRVSVVNSDAGTVASISAASPFTKQWEVATGANPRTLALTAPNGELWVANQDSATIRVLNGGTGATLATIPLPRGSRPFGIAINPAGTTAYVTLEGTGQLARLAVSSRSVTGTINVGRRPRGVAVSADGNRVFVSSFISPQDTAGEVREVSASSFTVVRTIQVLEDVETPSSESDGPGIPNYLQAITITPDGRGAWVPSKKDNTFRGTGPTSDGTALTFESTVRTVVSKLDLLNNVEQFSRRQDLNDSDLANAVVFNALGDYAFVSTQGNNHIEVIDALADVTIGSINNVGLAPQGLVRAGNLLFIQNFLSRDVAVYDVSGAGTSNVFPRIGAVVTQATEPLTAQILLGKRIFHNAADTRMSADSYISCASCHLDGDTDGRVWDFTQRGEGVRNTVDLLGRGGVSQQGPVHWTGNFDEIQDFENDIRGEFGGTGFMTNSDFTATSNPLGTPKAGRSADLDALAAYVSSLTQVHPSPFRNADGSMTADALAGKAIFERTDVGCATCHSGPFKTDSALNVLHNVGTITAASGKRINQTLTGFDTPTLIGAWETAPYLHDGSAATLMDVITTRNAGNQHGSTSQLSATERNQLVAYLQQLDSSDVVVETVAAPTFTPPAGSYTSAQSVTIATTTAGASIRYTINGAAPTPTSGTVYSGPVSIPTGTTTLRAIAYQTGAITSGVTTGVYVIGTPPTTLTWEAEALSRTSSGASTATQNDSQTSGGVWIALQADGVNDYVQYTLPAVPVGTYTLKMRYKGHPNRGRLQATFNGASVGGELDQYSGPSIYPEHTFGSVTVTTSGNQLVRLTVVGRNSSSGAYTLSSDTFTLEPTTAPQTVAAPTFNPPGGAYSSAQSVTISTTTSGASIRYTTNGSTPTSTSGTLYSGPVAISATTTLRAIAYQSGMTDSSVTSATYTINAPTPVTWEAEALSRTSSGASTATQNDSQTSGGVWIALQADGTNDYVQYTLPNVPAGTYTLKMRYKGHPNRGRLQATFNGTSVGGQLDQYSANSIYPEHTFGTVTVTTAGNQLVRLTVVGRNSSAGAYTLSSDTFTLTLSP